MFSINISFGKISFQVSYPLIAASSLQPLFSHFVKTTAESVKGRIEIIHQQSTDFYTIYSTNRDRKFEAPKEKLSLCLLETLADEWAAVMKDGLVLQSAALSWQQKTIIFPGAAGCGKATLAAYLAPEGFSPEASDLVYLPYDDTNTHCFPGPLRFDHHTEKGDITLLHASAESDCVLAPPSLIIFPYYVPGSNFFLEILSPAKSAMQVLKNVVNLKLLKGKSLHEAAKIARTIPAILLHYGHVDQLQGFAEHHLPFLLGHKHSPKTLNTFFSPFNHGTLNHIPVPLTAEQHKPKPIPNPIPAATPKGPKKKMTIGMATYDDYDGVYFSVQAIRMYHPEVADITEIFVLDNNPVGPCGQALKELEGKVKGYRYVPFIEHSSTTVRDYIFHNANSDYVLCIDCHVLIVSGAIKKLIDYYDAHPDCEDLLQGPMIRDREDLLYSHFDPVWRHGMYGAWAYDKRAEAVNNKPFEIPMQGLGLFSCRKDAWLGFNPRFRGFGGEEGYIHEKFRQNGNRALCLPFLRWMHRFNRPMGIPYPIQWEDRIFNYMVGLQELGLDCDPIREHFSEHLGEKFVTDTLLRIEEELNSPFFYFDAIYCITVDPDGERYSSMINQLKKIGIEKRVRPFKGLPTPDNHHIGRALSHRAIVASAEKQNLKRVLIFEDDTIISDSCTKLFALNIEKLKSTNWTFEYIGESEQFEQNKLGSHCSSLQWPKSVCVSNPIAYNNSIFQKIIDDIPHSYEAITEWIADNISIDQYLAQQNDA
ncbi:glycosyltransferase [Desulforhopalus singaporensis]|uniref:Glycosyltransferase family 25 (LPS biosynthesis protein) n=1 Tax=Desulforhopalus singaporensis TaxID=91360 RepID=A0A1H0VLI6_9BACT|nr:glycosyltransferase [Desulforhopalus singaporensis]SDP79377.1 Glycosyltransferase family 25 (LPS biosynthesis protein) [Desulforhopalus singaporensis]